MVPVIETPRLRLRGHRYDDFPNCVAMWSDPGVTRFIGGRPSTEQQTWARLLSYVGHWVLMGFGYWAVEERISGDFVGEVGLADFKRDIDSSMKSGPEIGFALATRFHGKGYATESARAALSWVDVHVQPRTTVCLINPENAASLHVAEKCGYETFARGKYNEQPALFLRRDRVMLKR
jgi:RimJ/RimL family protein N-acetyltransferase